ncbi:hypothetical protein BMS3Bbin02_01918 [bacterium BMS3Bbin02]|nr:hypothetical protein BMS3Bbin02_01918 [bacterium BMS3Bbin02]
MPELRSEVLDYLTAHHVMTLATHGTQGPWAAAVFYVNSGFTFTFLSSSRSRHAKDLAANPVCAATIHEDYHEWSEIKGIQMEGRVTMLSGTDRLAATRRYAEKFPLIQPGQAPALIKAALSRVAWYEFAPTRCYFVNNAKGFGHRDEVQLP